ncbi:MAG: Rrf2 family transcriptional regulator [Bacilli bacterium]
MQVTSRFTIGIHTVLCIGYFSDRLKVTSEFIAKSTNANPVVIRRILGQLKKAGLVSIKAGVGGASLSKNTDDITLYDIFKAVDAEENEMFSFHSNPNCKCPVGKNLHTVLNNHLISIEDAMISEMKKTNITTLLNETNSYL